MTRVLPAILGVLAAVVGCLSGPPRTPPSIPAWAGDERIVALTGSVGAMSLVAPGRDSGGGLVPVESTGLPLDAAWLSGSGSELLVTTLRGEVLLNQGPGLNAWVPAPGDLGGGHRSRAFGSLEPAEPAPASAGRIPRVAVVEGDPGLGGPGRLVIETAAGVVLSKVNLPSVPESAPGWLPDGRVAAVVRDGRDQPSVRLLDPTSGRMNPTSGPAVRSIAIAGGIVASIGTDGAARAGPVASWPAGGPLPIVAGGDGEVVLQAQPSPIGMELAIVVADVDGDAGSIRILAAAGGWHEIARFGLPSGANRAVVSWLAAW